MDKKVTIYSTPSCHYCHLAKDFFNQNGIKYEEYNVVSDLARRQEMVDKSGQMGVPVIVVGEDIVVGFDQPFLEEILEIKK
jgi:glutaredoxin 3